MAVLVEVLGEPDATEPAPPEAACVEVPLGSAGFDPVKTVEQVGDRLRVCDPTMLACVWKHLDLAGAAGLLYEAGHDGLAKDVLLSGSE